MWAYIKDRKSFATLLQRPVENWSICVDSIDLQQSTVTLACDDLPPTMARNWLLLGGRIYLIDRLQTDNGLTKLTLLPPWALFDREIIYTGSETSIGAFIRAWILAGWVNQADAEYATPYISCTNTDNTPFVAPEMDDSKVFDFLDYIIMARRKGVEIAFSWNNSGIIAAVRTHPVRTHTLVDGDGLTQLISNSVSGDAVAKVTVVYPTGENTYAHTYWYLAADGSISNSAPANRADGKWALIEIGEDDDQREKVQELVDGNARSYKVEFWSDVDMAVGDTYRMRLNGSVFEGIITAKFLSSDDNRIRYSSGDLATTLTERVNKIGGNK
jgi:hypothetical protein